MTNPCRDRPVRGPYDDGKAAWADSVEERLKKLEEEFRITSDPPHFLDRLRVQHHREALENLANALDLLRSQFPATSMIGLWNDGYRRGLTVAAETARAHVVTVKP